MTSKYGQQQPSPAMKKRFGDDIEAHAAVAIKPAKLAEILGMELKRTVTIIDGYSKCDFRYKNMKYKKRTKLRK